MTTKAEKTIDLIGFEGRVFALLSPNEPAPNLLEHRGFVRIGHYHLAELKSIPKEAGVLYGDLTQPHE